jgi:hypothetical protein
MHNKTVGAAAGCDKNMHLIYLIAGQNSIRCILDALLSRHERNKSCGTTPA